MNKKHLILHLGEALEELNRTLLRTKSDADYSEGEFWVAMQHLYHHLNTAWNARNLSDERIQQATDADFDGWGAYPLDLPTMKVKN